MYYNNDKIDMFCFYIVICYIPVLRLWIWLNGYGIGYSRIIAIVFIK